MTVREQINELVRKFGLPRLLTRRKVAASLRGAALTGAYAERIRTLSLMRDAASVSELKERIWVKSVLEVLGYEAGEPKRRVRKRRSVSCYHRRSAK